MWLYEIRNTTNDNVYIGQSANLLARWRDHRLALRQGKHHSIYLQHAWNKYGEQAFSFQRLLEVCTQEELDRLEAEYIANAQGRCYNIRPGGHKSTPSDETRKKISLALKGHTPWNKGQVGQRFASQETKGKMRKAMTGLKRTDKYKEYRRIVMIEKNPMENIESRKKKSLNLSMDTINSIRRYRANGTTYSELVEHFGISQTTIARIVKCKNLYSEIR